MSLCHAQGGRHTCRLLHCTSWWGHHARRERRAPGHAYLPLNHCDRRRANAAGQRTARHTFLPGRCTWFGTARTPRGGSPGALSWNRFPYSRTPTTTQRGWTLHRTTALATRRHHLSTSALPFLSASARATPCRRPTPSTAERARTDGGWERRAASWRWAAKRGWAWLLRDSRGRGQRSFCGPAWVPSFALDKPCSPPHCLLPTAPALLPLCVGQQQYSNTFHHGTHLLARRQHPARCLLAPATCAPPVPHPASLPVAHPARGHAAPSHAGTKPPTNISAFGQTRHRMDEQLLGGQDIHYRCGGLTLAGGLSVPRCHHYPDAHTTTRLPSPCLLVCTFSLPPGGTTHSAWRTDMSAGRRQQPPGGRTL